MIQKFTEKKAELILGGNVRLPKGFDVGVRVSRSTAGPGAGNPSVVFAFGGCRVKKTISYDDGEFDLVERDKRLSLYRGGSPFLDDVRIQPVAFHCPEQAFFNLDQRCIYHCVYCNSPFLGRDTWKDLNDDKILADIASMPGVVCAVALTSGVFGSVGETVGRMVSCIRKIRAAYPDMPVGVEPYVDDRKQIDSLREAGATEIKINCEAATSEVFSKVCPDLDYGNIFKMLAYAVEVFGKGHVASNLIYGFGEDNADVIARMEMLAKMGVAPGLRALKINPCNRRRIEDAVGTVEPNTPERVLSLAKEQKRIMAEYGIDTRTFRTMCFECTCCDIVPFRDI